MKKKNVLIIICAFSIINSVAQSNDYKTQRPQLALFNIGFNGLIGGVGSLINNNNSKVSFKSFAKGFYKGAIGGGVSHVAFSLSHQIDKQRKMAIAWPVRIINSIGSSFVLNAAKDKRLFESLHFNLYFTRLEYLPYRKKLKVKLFTSSIYGIAAVGDGAKFDLGKSLKSGILYFESNNRFSSAAGSGRATGQVSSIGMSTDLEGAEFYDTFAEEVAHIMQYDRKVGGNGLLYRVDQGLKKSSKFYTGLSNYIYFDLNGPIFLMAYKFQESSDCNFFEKEAINYANKRVDPCN